MITADNINWDLTATPRIEETPNSVEYLLSMAKQEILEYAIDLREDLGSTRSVLHATTTELAASLERERRLREMVARLQEELREERRRHQ